MRQSAARLRALLIRALGQASGLLLSGLKPLVGPDEDLWVFGCWYGKRFADSPRYMALSEATAGRRVVWLTRKGHVRAQARRAGLESYTWWQPKGLSAAMRASVWIYSHTSFDVSPIRPKPALTVLITHGTPLKRVGGPKAAGRVPAPLRGLAQRWTGSWGSPGIVCVATATAAERFASVMEPDQEIRITGYPRWDSFYQGRSQRPQLPVGRTAGVLDQTAPTLLYAPTQRGYGLREFDASMVPGFDEFTSECVARGFQLYFRGHFAQQSEIVASEHWIDLSAEVVDDVNDVLPDVDVLITDYSSIWYDYVLFKDKVAFLVPDLETYRNADQGLFVGSLDSEVPGPVCDDWEAVAAWMRAGMPMAARRLSELRREASAVSDGNASARIVDLITTQGSEACVDSGYSV